MRKGNLSGMEKLTKQLQQDLLCRGYRYFVLSGVRRIEQDIAAVYIMYAVRSHRGVKDTLISITDSIVNAVLNKENNVIKLYVKKDKTHPIVPLENFDD